MSFFQETISMSLDEEIIGAFRSHSIVAVLAVLPFACALIVTCLFVFPLLSLGGKGIVFFALLVVLELIFIGTALSQWIGTIIIVTTRRIIKIDRRSFFKKHVNEYQLEAITEISYDSKGMLQTLFALGDINITALYTGTRYTIIKNVSGPQRVLDSISHTIARAQKIKEQTKNTSNSTRLVRVSGDESIEN